MKIQCKGIANKSAKGEILDVYFPCIEYGEKRISSELQISNNLNQELIEINWNEEDLGKPIENVEGAYLKLQLLSNKFVLPNSININGLFSNIPNVVWTNQGPISIEEIDKRLHESKLNNNDLHIKSVDKFPCLTDYIVPRKVRIADTSRVRLGAYKHRQLKHLDRPKMPQTPQAALLNRSQWAPQ